ncbi:MAG: hypothetical protein ACLKAK_09705 [Alkaliphilus sp.]
MGVNYRRKFEKDYQALWDKLNSVTADNRLIVSKAKDHQILQDKLIVLTPHMMEFSILT